MTAGGAGDLHAFVLELGRALSLAGTGVNETQERLGRVVTSAGGRRARVVVLPTALMIAFGRAGWATIESTPQLAGTLRLDQISALYELVHEAERGEVEPADGLRRLQRIRAMPPRHGPVVTVLAYAAMTVALCLVLEPSARDVAIPAAFGALIGDDPARRTRAPDAHAARSRVLGDGRVRARVHGGRARGCRPRGCVR